MKNDIVISEATQLVTEGNKKWLVARRETEDRISFSVYESTYDNDSSKTHRIFKGVSGSWRLYLMSHSESGMTDTIEWALDERNRISNFRQAIIGAKTAKEGLKAAMALLKAHRDESIDWAMNKYYAKCAAVIRRVVMKAYPEAEKGRLHNQIFVVVDKGQPVPAIESVKPKKSRVAAYKPSTT